MTVLVTGLGYIGSAVARALLERGERVVAVENMFSTLPRVVARLGAPDRFRLVRGSINSPLTLDQAFAGEDVRAVIHLAAQASAHPRAATASYTERTNLVGPRLVFERAAQAGALTWIHGSSFRVYGDELAGAVDEDAPYGKLVDLAHLSKVYAEKLIEMLAGQHGARAVNARLGVVYGLGPVMKRDPRFLTVPNLFCMRTAAAQPLTVHPGANRPIGFVHLDDAVRALLSLLDQTGNATCAAANVVTEVLTVGEVADHVGAAAAARGLEVRVEGAAPAPMERWRVISRLDPGLTVASRDMASAVGEVLDYYLECLGHDPAR
ncbi:MAG: NAD(P)-dependent oxidoreductase [Chloroflexota bacterium]